MRRLIATLIIFLTALQAGGTVSAAKPNLRRISPAGGQIGQTVTVTIADCEKSTKIWCSHPEIKITPGEKTGIFQFEIPSGVLPGNCWLRLYNHEGASELKQFQLGTNPELAELEPNNELNDSQKIAQLPVLVNGVLHKGGETDCYTFSLKKGETLIASMSANESVGSPMDAVLQLVSSKGFVLDQNDDNHGFDPQIVFTAPADDTYTIRTFAFPSKPNQSINYSGSPDYIYRLLLTTGPFIDYPEMLNVNLQPSSVASVIGWNIPDNLKQIPVKLLPDSDEALIHAPELTNSVRIRTVEYPCLKEAKPDNNQPQAIMVPSSVTGVIELDDDTDQYQFIARKNQELAFQIESQEMGYPLDSVLRLKDSEGKVLNETDDVSSAKDSTIKYTFKEAGTYTMEVTDRFSHGGPRYVYLLTTTEVIPDFSIEVAGNSFVIPKDKPLEIPVTIKREKFNQEITVKCIGLPKDIQCAAVTSSNKGETAKSVKLIIENKGTEPWSGSFDIVAHPVNNEEQTRKASAPLADYNSRTGYLWLTGLKPEPVKEEVKKEEEKPTEEKK